MAKNVIHLYIGAGDSKSVPRKNRTQTESFSDATEDAPSVESAESAENVSLFGQCAPRMLPGLSPSMFPGLVGW